MADLITQASKPMTDAEYSKALAQYITDTQHLLDSMLSDQVEIDQLKHKSIMRDGEIRTLKMHTRKILTRLEAII